MALVALRPHTALFADLRAPHGWIARVGIDGAAAELAAAALWVTAGWLAIGLLAAGIAALPGSCGRTGRPLVAAALLPRAIHRFVVGATGLGIVLTPVASHAATPPQPTRKGAVCHREPVLADVGTHRRHRCGRPPRIISRPRVTRTGRPRAHSRRARSTSSSPRATRCGRSPRHTSNTPGPRGSPRPGRVGMPPTAR